MDDSVDRKIERTLTPKALYDLSAADPSSDASTDKAQISITPMQLMDHVDDLAGPGTTNRVTQ
jgi:hypothetical protein